MRTTGFRKIQFLFFSLMFLALGCDDNDDSITDPIEGQWSVVNISGGFAGINDDYTAGTLIWSFDALSNTLTVTNNNTANTIYDGLDSGKYPYTLLTVDEELYLLINGQEFGGITLEQNRMTLDQNDLSTGTGADGFVLVLEQ